MKLLLSFRYFESQTITVTLARTQRRLCVASLLACCDHDPPPPLHPVELIFSIVCNTLRHSFLVMILHPLLYLAAATRHHRHHCC